MAASRLMGKRRTASCLAHRHHRFLAGLAATVLLATSGAHADSQISHEEASPRQYLSPQLSYLVLDKDRNITRHGIGMAMQYGRQLSDHVWWETEFAGYNLESGIRNGTDYYQGALTTGLAYAFGDRRHFTPYLAAGLGAIYSDVLPDEDDGFAFHANAGLGAVTGPVFDNGLKLRAEARYLYDDASGAGDAGSFGDWRYSLGVEIPLGYTRIREVEKVVYQTREVEKVVEKPFVDSDGDGIADERDRCPATLSGAKVDASGCMIANQTITFNNINFEPGSSTISPTSRGPLDQLVNALQAQTDFNVEVAGHTDSTGAATYNLTLSRQRAQAVRSYLVSHGVDGDRLTAEGFGELQPVASNETQAGRAMNRRVEFRVIEQGAQQ
ncbi:OmpA family protein [Alcanivorax hongdengensis A-11-3]|uniref:OmpA family protein n=1 Tax=Alcanivorax hongdengensis A-11-3 TaxID=1177179 RepID=L0WEC1_9GAMM|nr:OmpA family protein [Alcanivorax hongdengensis]EKF75074.1 OmpA family protein [Alcanivorax hongdengensis A-11-3]